MDYTEVVDKWAIEFDVQSKIPTTEFLAILLINLSLVDFIRNEVDEDFIEYVAKKFSPNLPSNLFFITKEIVKKQILSCDKLLSENKSKPRTLDDIDEFTPPENDREYLDSLGFDTSRLRE